MIRHRVWRPAAAMLIVLTLAMLHGAGPAAARLQDATPTTDPCATAPMPPATPAGMDMGTPMSGMDHGAMGTPDAAVEIDQLYIDMMIPHHLSIVALAEAALPRLDDERLIELAEAVIVTQREEVEELRGYREQFYGSPDPMPLDQEMMGRLMPTMPGGMDAMMAQMDPVTQVALFCAAPDPDLAFIDLTIPHHQSAIVASEITVAEAAYDEIRTFAEAVIEVQQAEIDQLQTIRTERYGSATPED